MHPYLGFFVVLLAVAAGTARGVTHNVVEYGARGDGVHENARPIQQAIDAASAAGGGVVLFPPGTYRTATLFLKDNVTLRLDRGATILGTPDYSLYPADIKPVYETFLLREDRYAPRVPICISTMCEISTRADMYRRVSLRDRGPASIRMEHSRGLT